MPARNAKHLKVKRLNAFGASKLDAAKLDASRTPDGFIRAFAPITKCGVFTYQYSDGTTLRELRHPDDVMSESALRSMEMMPVQVDHVAMVTPDNAKNLQVGHVGEDIQVGSPYVNASICITAREGIKALEDGKNQLSCGYFCDLILERGEYNGQSYDARQVNIQHNHLALCAQARLGPELSIQMDSMDAILVNEDESPSPGAKPAAAERRDSPSHQEKPMVKVVINGISYDAAPEVANELARLNGALEQVKKDSATESQNLRAAAESEKTGLQQKVTEWQGKADGYKAELDAVKAEHTPEKLKAKVDSAVKARLGLERVAAKVLDSEAVAKLDGMSDLDVQKAVILARDPKAKLDGKDAAYIATRFEIATENLDADNAEGAIASSRESAAPRQDGASGGDAIDLARKKMIENMQNPKAAGAAK